MTGLKDLSGGRQVLILMIILLCSYAGSPAAGSNEEKISSGGWTVTASGASATLVLAHDSLGIVLDNITLCQNEAGKISELKEWTLVKQEEGLLTINTVNPFTSWTFKPGKDGLIISSTLSGLCITARAPVSSGRIPARLLDPEGIPVCWSGTSEISVSWNGKETRNPSKLPSVNPEVMTFSLGPVSAANLHALFDRDRDIALSFPVNTTMTRKISDPSSMAVTIPVPGRALIRIIPDYYTSVLGLPVYEKFDDSVFPTAPVIWGSWTAYYHEAKESDIVANTDWISANLLPYGFSYVQLDDGYDRGSEEGHYWISNWRKDLFPHGPEWLTGYIKSKGLKPGLWLVPNAYAGFFKKHPEWYLYDRSGKVIRDYKTPALDQTNPEVKEWLKKLFTTLRGWGFEYYKFDGEFSLPLNIPDVDTSRIYGGTGNYLADYRERLKLIREVVGPGTFIEGCVAGTPLNGTGYFNSCFNGDDMYNSWKGSYAVFSSVNANAFLNHMVMYSMPGEGIDVSPYISPEEASKKLNPRTIEVALSREDPFTGFGTTLTEARTLVSFISLTGVPYPLTSIMKDLPGERLQLLKKTMPTVPVMPVDLFSRGTDMAWDKFKHTTPDTYIHDYPEIIDLKVNAVSGIYDVVAVTNWRGEKTKRHIDFRQKLGMEDASAYIVFDFWNQELAGVFNSAADIEVDAHDTRVLLIHPASGKPQLIGNSRHISGVVSIKSLEYDEQQLALSGQSETIKGDPYSLFFFIPEGMKLLKAAASDPQGKILSCKTVVSGSLLRLDTGSQGGTIDWKLQFSTVIK